MEEAKPLFTKKSLAMLVWPILVEQLLAVFVGTVDVLMVSVVGENAVSGVSLVDSISNLIIQVLFAMTSGGTVVCAQFIGAKDKRKAGISTAQLILITVVVTGVITLIMSVFKAGIMGALFGSVEEEVMADASVYLTITVLSYPFLALYNSGAAGFRAMGNTKMPMIVSLIMNGMNIAGNAIGVFVLHMGVAGVALPTLISRATGAIIIIVLLQSKKNEARIQGAGDFVPNGAIIKKILCIGIPNGLESGIFQFGKVFLQSLVSTLGTSSIAGYAVASNLVTYLYLSGNSIGSASLTVVGQCYGANKRSEARRYMKMLLVANYCILAVVSVAMALSRGYLVGLYSLSAESAGYASALVLSHCIADAIWPLAFLIPYYFRASGKAMLTMAIAIFSMWVFRVGMAYVFIKGMHMSVVWVWIAMYIDWIFRMIVYVVLFVRDRKKNGFVEARE